MENENFLLNSGTDLCCFLSQKEDNTISFHLKYKNEIVWLFINEEQFCEDYIYGIEKQCLIC